MKYRSLICDALKYVFSHPSMSQFWFLIMINCSNKCLKEWLQLMLSYVPLTEKFFEDYALIRHPNVFQKYVDCVSRLNDHPFELDVNYELKQQQRLGGNHFQQHQQQQEQVESQPTQVLANIGSLFSSLLKSNEEGGNEQPKQKSGGLFGFKSMFN